MHEDNQFGRCGRTLLWISDHILHRALLSLPSPSSGYGRRNREEGIGNNWFYCGTTHDVHNTSTQISLVGISFITHVN
ncbi:hypothetical protein ACOSQ2_007335 [Xanthoceras sorbifolium]